MDSSTTVLNDVLCPDEIIIHIYLHVETQWICTFLQISRRLRKIVRRFCKTSKWHVDRHLTGHPLDQSLLVDQMELKFLNSEDSTAIVDCTQWAKDGFSKRLAVCVSRRLESYYLEDYILDIGDSISVARADYFLRDHFLNSSYHHRREITKAFFVSNAPTGPMIYAEMILITIKLLSDRFRKDNPSIHANDENGVRPGNSNIASDIYLMYQHHLPPTDSHFSKRCFTKSRQDGNRYALVFLTHTHRVYTSYFIEEVDVYTGKIWELLCNEKMVLETIPFYYEPLPEGVPPQLTNVERTLYFPFK